MRWLLFLVLILLTACAPVFSHGTVTHVIDGDTFVLDSGEHVRLTCVNTPEIGQPLHDEAQEYLKSLVLNKEVLLESDTKDKDKYGRLLRYVYVDNVSINALMVQSGFAVVLRIPPNVKHCDIFEKIAAER